MQLNNTNNPPKDVTVMSASAAAADRNDNVVNSTAQELVFFVVRLK